MGETLPGRDHGFVWIDVVDPHDSEITLLQHSFGLHELAIEDSMSDAQPAKLDFYADHVFIVAKVAEFGSDQIVYTDINRSEEHTSELQVTNAHLVCRLLLEKNNINTKQNTQIHN